MADLTMKQGDTFPPLKSQLKQKNQLTEVEEVINLASALKVRFVLRDVATKNIGVTGECSASGGASLSSSGASGWVEYYWRQTDLTAPVEPGEYYCEFEIEWPEPASGKQGFGTKQWQSVPNAGYRTIMVVAGLKGGL